MNEAANPQMPREVAAVLAVQACVRGLTLIKQQRVAQIIEQIAAILSAESDLTVRALAVSMVNLTITTEIKNAQAKVSPKVVAP